MSFGEQLQGKSSHDALVALQEAEIRLLENIKKCLTSRIKLDRDYAAGLADIVATAHKFDPGDFKSPLFQAWALICKEVEVQQKLIHDSADRLCTNTLDCLCRLITDKKATRRFYIDERERLEVEFHKIQEESQKHKTEYEKVLEKCMHEKAKYEDTQTKGKPLVKIEEAKNRYCKSAGKLHRVHNDYVMSLRELNNHQRNYLTTTLPGLLDFQQNIQQAMVQKSQNILSEYVTMTDSTSETFVKCQRQMRQCVSAVDPQTEYNDYIDKHKTDRLESTKFEFDKKLLEDYKGTLRLNEIAVDELTVENLRNRRATFQERLASCQRKRETKEKELKMLQDSLSEKPPDKDINNADRKSADEERQAVEVLKKDIAELKCFEDKHTALYNLVNDPLTQLGESTPPQAVVFTDVPAEPGEHRTSVSYDDAGPSSPTTGSTGTLSKRLQNFRLKIPFRKGPSTPPPKLPSKDTLDKCPPDDGSMDKYQNNEVEEEEDGEEGGEEGKERPPVGVKQVNNVAGGEPGDRPNSNVQRHNSGASDSYHQVRRKFNSRPTTPYKMTLQPNRKLEDEEWFHGVLPREEVQRLLVQDGDYLVRESRNRKTGQPQHVLSVMWSGHKHFIIQGQEGSWRFEGQQYKTIQELVIQQHRSNLPVTNKSQAILCSPIVREDWELKNDDIELGENIGHGNFGEVYRGIYKKNKQDVAVKTCRETLSDDAKKKFLQEGRILKQYNHPNIVSFIGIAAQRNPVMIVMEYVPGGSLLQFLRTQGSLQTTKQLIKMCEDAAAGMAYLEGRGCIHRDLAARNCLVGKNHVVKISDFGMSREEEEYTVSGGPKQIPIKWTAPEALHFGKYTTMCDIWSYGILMWEIFAYGDPPYNGLTNKQAREKIDTGYRMPAPEKTPEEVYVLMLRCWDVQPENRPHFAEIHKELCSIRTKVLVANH